MINIQLNTGTPEQKVYQEGMIEDVLKRTAADEDERKAIDTAFNGDGTSKPTFMDKLSATNQYGIQKAKDTADAIDQHILKKARVDNASIVARARNSILQFPCYIAQSCPVTPAQTVAKLFERVYTTLVQTVLSQNQVLDEDEANSLVFLKQFHTNLKESTERFLAQYESLINPYYQPIDELDRMMCESIYCEHKINDEVTVEFRVVPTTHPDLIAECARLCNEPLTGFTYLSEGRTEKNTETTTKYTNLDDDALTTAATERIRDRCRKEAEDALEDEKPGEEEFAKCVNDDEKQQLIDDWQAKVDSEFERLLADATTNDKIKEEVRAIKDDIRAGKVLYTRFDGINFKKTDTTRKDVIRRANADRAVDAPVILKEADIKKMNAMLPYTIEATFRLRTRNGIDRDIKYIIGIKTVMHLIRTQDLADDLRDLVTGRIKSLQKVRYKTGEISFKDYLFNTKQLKADAAKSINYNKRWVNTLKRLADYNDQYGSLLNGPTKAITGGSVPIPNGTLVLTQPDITMLTNQTGIDLSQVSNAKRLAKSLFLIAICIIDSSAGTMRVLFPDSDTDWDVQSLAAIDAEVAKTDNSPLMRELNHIVNR